MPLGLEPNPPASQIGALSFNTILEGVDRVEGQHWMSVHSMPSEGRKDSLCVASQSGSPPPYCLGPFVCGASEDCLPELAPPFWINIYGLEKSLLLICQKGSWKSPFSDY